MGAAVLAVWGHAVGLAAWKVCFLIWCPSSVYGCPWVALAVFGALLGAYVGLRPRRWWVVCLWGLCYPPALHLFWLIAVLVRSVPVFLGNVPREPAWLLHYFVGENVWEMLLILPVAQAVSGWIDRRSREIDAEGRAAAAGPRRDADGTWEL